MRTLALLPLVCSALASIAPSSVVAVAQTVTAADTVVFAQVPVHAERGSLTVPESRAHPERRRLTLGYMRFRTLSPNPGPPTFWLAGGPGESGIADIGNAGHVLMSLLAIGDVVVLDQRGTSRSSSSLDCPERWVRQPDRPGSWGLILSHMRTAMERCVRHYAAQGVDFSAYNTSESADDVNDLRRALGYDRINLFGTSYGTHLGLEFLRRHGTSVHRAVLAAFYWQFAEVDSSVSTDDKLRPIVERIRADTMARRRLPDPIGTIHRLLAELDRRPAVVDVASGASDTTRLVIGRFDAELALTSGISLRQNATRWLVRTLVDAAKGDLARLANGVRRRGRLNAMATAIGCAEGLHSYQELRALCTIVPYTDRAAQFRSFFQSDAPVLFVAGTMDVDRGAVEAWRAHLSASEILVIENGFHDDYYSFWPLYGDHVLKFLEGESVDGRRVRLPLEFDFGGDAE